MKIFKKVNGKCNVKGCRSSGKTVNTYYMSVSEGYGASVIMCANCIIKAFNALNSAETKQSPEVEVMETEESATEEQEQLTAEKSGEEVLPEEEKKIARRGAKMKSSV